MLIKAAATGTLFAGAITMALYSLGMAPALMAVGSVSSILSSRMRKGAEQLAAVTVILLGAILILRGFRVPYLAWLLGAGHSGMTH